MRTFQEFVEHTGELYKLYDLLLNFLRGDSPWKNKNYHHTLVRQLQTIGWDDDAREIALLEPTKEEMEYANRPMFGSMNVSAILQHKQDKRIGEIFSMKHSHYSHKVDELLDKLLAQGIGKD